MKVQVVICTVRSLAQMFRHSKRWLWKPNWVSIRWESKCFSSCFDSSIQSRRCLRWEGIVYFNRTNSDFPSSCEWYHTEILQSIHLPSTIIRSIHKGFPRPLWQNINNIDRDGMATMQSLNVKSLRNLYDLALHLVQTQISCLATASTFIDVYDRNGIHHSIKSAERQRRCQSVEATKVF